jgi:hypothetical protein
MIYRMWREEMKKARAAYEAYVRRVEKSEEPMPSWFELPVAIQEGWRDAALAARQY